MEQKRRHAITMNPRYHDGLIEFKKRCTDYPSIKCFLNNIFAEDVMSINSYIKSLSKSKMCDVGCGDGTITSYLSDLIVKTSKRILYIDVVEPLKCYIDQTHLKIRNLDSKLLIPSFINKKAEQFFADGTTKQYNLILSSHSFHLIPLNTLTHVLSSIAPNGYLIVIIGAKESIMSALKDLFLPGFSITGADILNYIRAQKGNYCKIKSFHQPSYLDLNDVKFPQRKKDLPEKSKNLISLMIQTNIDEIGQDDYELVKHLIVKRLEGGKLKLKNDAIMFHNTPFNNNTTVIVKK